MLSGIQKILRKHRGILLYALFGAITTLVNYMVYFPLYNTIGLSATVSNSISWFAAVIAAFLTNKPFVFKSHDWSLSVAVPEFLRFIGVRIASGVTETLILLLTVDVLSWNGNVLKFLTSIIVIIANYFGSKLLVFCKR